MRQAPPHSEEPQRSTPSPRGRPRSAETEETILQAALDILDHVGYGAFTIEAVAARTGVGRPTIYRRWPSKVELAIEAVVRLAPRLEVVESDDAVADLRRLVSQFVPDITRSATGRVIIALAIDPNVHAELANRLDERYLQPRRAVLAHLLKRAAGANQIRADVDLDLLIDLIMGATTYRWLVTGSPVTPQSALSIVDAVLKLSAPQP